MSEEQPPLDPRLIEQTKQQIRGLINEITQLTRSEIAPEDFHEQFLPKVIEALAAVGGAVWSIDENRMELAYQVNLQETKLQDMPDEQAQHSRLLQKVMVSGEGMLSPPHSGTGDDSEAANPTDFLLIFGPIKTDVEVVGVVEIIQRPNASPNARDGYLRFLMQMCDLAGDFFKSRKLKHFSDRQAMWTQLEEFTRRVHAGLDPRETAYTIANEGRRLIECDRVSLAIKRGRRCRIEAVSGQDMFDKRSNTVRLLGNLATAVVAGGEPVWYQGDTTDMAPQIEDAVQEYVDDSHSKTVAVLPLMRPRPEPTDDKEEEDLRDEPEVAVGALVVELIEDVRVSEKMQQRVDVVALHSATSLTNAMEHDNLFLMPLWRTLGKARWLIKARTLPWTSVIAVIVLIVIGILTIVKIDFEMPAEGKLEPVEQRNVFAGIDGLVEEVFVDPDDRQTFHHVLISSETSSDERDVQAVFGKDLQSSGGSFRMLNITSRNAGFQSAGVQPKDVVRVFVAMDDTRRDEWGNVLETPSEFDDPANLKALRFLVDEVVDDQTIRLDKIASQTLADRPHKIEIWRSSLLVRLSNNELDRAIEGVLGQINVTQQQIDAIQRGASGRDYGDKNRESISGRDVELLKELVSYQTELALYRLQQQELLVTSPLEGEVVTWKVDEILKGRPVQLGQRLMRVVNPEGDWELEIEMPDKNMGEIGKAQRDLKEGEALEVEYILYGDSGTKWVGTVKEIGRSAEVRGDEGNTVLIKVEIDTDELKAELPELWPGTTVRARIRCGKRPIGYVWFYDAMAYLQSRILFRL